MPDHLERKAFQNERSLRGHMKLNSSLYYTQYQLQMLQYFGKSVQPYLVKLNIVLDPAILLLGMSVKETSARVHQEPCTEMFIATLSYMGKNLATVKLKGEWVNCVLVVCLYNKIKISKQMSSTQTRLLINIGNKILSEKINQGRLCTSSYFLFINFKMVKKF